MYNPPKPQLHNLSETDVAIAIIICFLVPPLIASRLLEQQHD
jgi:hypothetical protein